MVLPSPSAPPPEPPEPPTTAGDRTTYLLVDGENIDTTLGTAILERKPGPAERPRWDRLLTFTRERWGGQVRALFFLNATNTVPMSFLQALRAMDYRVVPLSGPPGVKIVDVAIQRTLQAVQERPGDVLLVSNDGDFVDDLGQLLDDTRQVGVMGFTEFRSTGFIALEERGLQTFDLEHDVRAFTAPLPRLRVIPIEEFDPAAFLG